MGRVRLQPLKPVDHFGNFIEVGDAYFYGSPPQAGKVTKVTGMTIEIIYKSKVWDSSLGKWIDGYDTMKCKSPEKGVCLDKTYDKEIT